jgi:CRP/FNR family transcriptional regulator, nitrogen oxide reductase regulator
MLDAETSPGEKIAFVHRLSLFSDVSPTECSTIVSAAREKCFARREIIFFEGDPVQHVVMLLSGCVKVTQLGFGGDEVILRLCGIGDVVGGFHVGSDHFSTAQAVQPSTALVWQAATFEALLDRFPALYRNTLRTLEDRLQEMEQRFREVATEKVGPRLSSELIRLSNRLGSGVTGKTEISLSRAELAQLTGTTLFTVSRLLSRWKKEGIVGVGRETVQVRDYDALSQLAESE